MEDDQGSADRLRGTPGWMDTCAWARSHVLVPNQRYWHKN